MQGRRCDPVIAGQVRLRELYFEEDFRNENFESNVSTISMTSARSAVQNGLQLLFFGGRIDGILPSDSPRNYHVIINADLNELPRTFPD